MSQVGSGEVADRAVRISELIEEVILLDELLATHKLHGAHHTESQQYIDRRSAFIEELNSLLNPHHIRVIHEDQAA